jgi:hypothetical protein
MGRATRLAIAVFWLHACGGADAPSVAGTWSGSMILDSGKGESTSGDVEVTFTQDGNRIEGRWRTLEGAEATGLVSGTITREESRHAVNVRFTYAGRHPGRSDAGANCVGSARADGQLTFNTTMDTAGQPSRERPGWYIRLKAFEGFTFEACPPIGYATWTLSRPQ